MDDIELQVSFYLTPTLTRSGSTTLNSFHFSATNTKCMAIILCDYFSALTLLQIITDPVRDWQLLVDPWLEFYRSIPLSEEAPFYRDPANEDYLKEDLRNWIAGATSPSIIACHKPTGKVSKWALAQKSFACKG